MTKNLSFIMAVLALSITGLCVRFLPHNSLNLGFQFLPRSLLNSVNSPELTKIPLEVSVDGYEFKVQHSIEVINNECIPVYNVTVIMSDSLNQIPTITMTSDVWLDVGSKSGYSNLNDFSLIDIGQYVDAQTLSIIENSDISRFNFTAYGYIEPIW